MVKQNGYSAVSNACNLDLGPQNLELNESCIKIPKSVPLCFQGIFLWQVMMCSSMFNCLINWVNWHQLALNKQNLMIQFIKVHL